MAMIELLEERQLLTAAPLHNLSLPEDVNHDGRVTANDALIVINDLMRNGPHTVSTSTTTGSASPTVASAASATASPYLIDVNGDNRITASDALKVINQLANPLPMTVTTFATDLAGNPISNVQLGQTFLIETDVQDTRSPTSQFPGVFSAYVDLQYTSGLISIGGQSPVAGPDFSLVPSGETLDVSNPGIVPHVGVISKFSTSTDANIQKAWTIMVTATSAGTLNLQPAFDFIAGDEDNEFGSDAVLQPADIQFNSSQVAVIGLPSISVAAPAATNEGNSGTTPFVFTVSLSNAASQQVTVAYSTVDGTATAADNDYTPTSGTLTFAVNDLQKTVTVLVKGDLKVESDETFSLLLSNASSNATIDAGSSVISATDTATIKNDDVLPTLAISDAQATASTTTTTTEVFTVSVAGSVQSAVNVTYATSNVTAQAGTDYTATSGTLTFTPGGQTSQLITVTVLANPSPTGDETFQVNLTSPVNATFADATGIGTIHPPFLAPTVSFSPATVTHVEGNSGTTIYLFTANLSHSSTQAAVVTYATADGTATIADNDYAATSGTITFQPTETSKVITVLVNGDTNVEPNETFKVNLAAVSGATGTSQATGTILNDDGIPSVSISDATVVAAAPGTYFAQFTVSISAASAMAVTLSYQTQDNTAFAGLDYASEGTILTFNPGGALSQIITVPVFGTSIPTPDVNFFVNLSAPSNGVIGDGVGVGTIVRQGISVLDASSPEGNPPDMNHIVFTVSLSLPLDHAVTVAYATADGTATSSDYTATSGTLTFAAGVTSQTISVAITADTIQEPNETFTLNLSNPVGDSLINDHAVGTILNDDGTDAIVTLVLADSNGVALPAGSSLTVGQQFILEAKVQDARSLPSNDTLRGIASAYVNALYDSNLVGLVSKNESIIFGPDFPNFQQGDLSTLGQINGAGGFTGSIDQIPTDAAQQQLQLLFGIPLMAKANGLAAFSVGPTTVAGQDIENYEVTSPIPNSAINFVYTAANPLTINIGHNVFVVNNVSQNEGNSGTVPFVFTVSRLIPDATTASVEWSTSDGTATAGSDYIATSGTLTFSPTDTTMQVTVMVNGDTIDEDDETFNDQS